MNVFSLDQTLSRLSPRRRDSHKGNFGRVLLVGGSRGMAGAIVLAGLAALRSGAGLVTLAVPDICLDTVASFEPSLMTAPLPSDSSGRLTATARDTILPWMEKATAIGCGPGLGRSNEITDFVNWLYCTARQASVFDADALNALAVNSNRLTDSAGPRVLTPHLGEFRRLIGEPELTADVARQRVTSFATKHALVTVFKGHRSIITNGEKTVENATGNPGMATAGTGDVLTGILTALLAQGLEPLAAARLAVHVHGVAGDLAAAKTGEISLIASDLLQQLPSAFSQCLTE